MITEEMEALNAHFGRMTLPGRVKLLWVMKESLLKTLGVGFYYGLGSVRLIGANEIGPVFTIRTDLQELSLRPIYMSFGFIKSCIFCITIICTRTNIREELPL